MIGGLSTPKFIEDQLAKGEKVKRAINQTAYIVLRETVAFTDRRVIVYRRGFGINSIREFAYDNISSIYGEKTRPIECLAAFIVSILAIAAFYYNVDLTMYFPTDYATPVYISFISGIISGAVIAYYVYRGYGRLKAIAIAVVLLGLIAIAWYFIHYLLPVMKEGTLTFFATNEFTKPYYWFLEYSINDFYSILPSQITGAISTLYGIIALFLYIIRLSLILLNIEESWDTVTIHPYNPEIIKIIREATGP